MFLHVPTAALQCVTKNLLDVYILLINAKFRVDVQLYKLWM